MKKFLKSAVGREVVVALLTAYLRLAYVTSRIEVRGREHLPVGGAVFAIWHGRTLLMPLLPRRHKQLYALISEHRDGRLISTAARWFSIKTINGSSSKNGARAFLQMIKTVKTGGWISITPDGPKGPAHSVSDGTIELPRKADVPLIPVATAASKFWQINSWDSLQVPKLFGRLVIQIHPAFELPVGQPRAALKTAFGKHLQQLQNALEIEVQ